jgi:hypothetical protein
MMARVTFTDVEKLHIKVAANAVWREIGFDILIAVAEQSKGRFTPESATVSREDVIDVVLDADRLHDRLRRNMGKPGVELWKKMQCASHQSVMRLMREIFTYETYGA